MNPRTRIEKMIDSKRQEISQLEAEIEKAQAFILGLQEALKALPREFGDVRPTEQLLRPGSDMAKVKDFLLQLGEPAYITKILEGIGKENNKKNRLSVSGSINNYVRRGEIFTKPSPNTFGLKEFSTSEPPPSNNQANGENKDIDNDDFPFK